MQEFRLANPEIISSAGQKLPEVTISPAASVSCRTGRSIVRLKPPTVTQASMYAIMAILSAPLMLSSYPFPGNEIKCPKAGAVTPGSPARPPGEPVHSGNFL